MEIPKRKELRFLRKKVRVYEFLDVVSDLIEHPDVLALNDYSQHCNTTRYQHVVNVAYYCFLMARRYNLDVVSITRAAMLHDLYAYDWHQKGDRAQHHAFHHPKVALENAHKVTEVNEIMEDCILHHMWPLCAHAPKSKEAWFLQAMDKFCALGEVTSHFAIKFRIPKRVAYTIIALFTIQRL